MVFPGGLPIESHVYIRGYNVTVENEVYEGVTAGELISRLIELVEIGPVIPEQSAPSVDMPAPEPGKALTQVYLWSRINRTLHSRHA